MAVDLFFGFQLGKQISVGDIMQTQTSEAVFIARRRERLLRLREVLIYTGLSRAGLYRLIDAGKFPCPVKLTRKSVAWPESEVQDWIGQRIEARDAR